MALAVITIRDDPGGPIVQGLCEPPPGSPPLAGGSQAQALYCIAMDALITEGRKTGKRITPIEDTEGYAA